jgi:hypothetical protein
MSFTFIISFCTFISAQAQSLSPYLKNNGKFIYVDSITMKSVINDQFDDAEPFREGFAIVKKNNQYFVIDKLGKYLPINFHEYPEYSEGLFATEKNEKWGFVDQYGNTVVPFEYDIVKRFSEGLAIVKKNGNLGFINRDGSTVIAFGKYDQAEEFHEGLAWVYRYLDMKYGVIDKNGDLVIPFSNNRPNTDFSDGISAIKIKDSLRNITSYALINKNGIITPTQYEGISPFVNGIAWAQNKNRTKYVLINKSGVNIFPTIYSLFTKGQWYFNNDLCPIIREDGKTGIINSYGVLLIDYKYDFAYNYMCGYSKILVGDTHFYIDTKGREYREFQPGN